MRSQGTRRQLEPFFFPVGIREGRGPLDPRSRISNSTQVLPRDIYDAARYPSSSKIPPPEIVALLPVPAFWRMLPGEKDGRVSFEEERPCGLDLCLPAPQLFKPSSFSPFSGIASPSFSRLLAITIVPSRLLRSRPPRTLLSEKVGFPPA